MKYAMKYIDLPDAGCVTLFGALPCAWGSGWQNMHRYLRGGGRKYTQHMNVLYKQFKCLILNF